MGDSKIEKTHFKIAIRIFLKQLIKHKSHLTFFIESVEKNVLANLFFVSAQGM